MQIEYEQGKYLVFELNNKNFFMGACNEKKWKLFRSFKRFETGKRLSELEENVYGDDGINFMIDGKNIKSKGIHVHLINSRESIIEALKYKKDSLMYQQMQSYESSFEINRLIDQLNEDILRIELKIQEDFSQFSDSVSPTFVPVNYTNLLKNYLLLSYIEDDHLFPVEMMDISELLNEYCRLLLFEINRSGEEHWIVLRNIESFLYGDNLKYFVDELEKIRTCLKTILSG